MRPVILIAAALLAGCAQQPPPQTAAPVVQTPPPREPIVRNADGTILSSEVRLGQSGPEARALLEELAARCWLDGIVGGAQLIVDRASGRVVIVGDSRDLLAADLVRGGDGITRLRVSGPAVDPNHDALIASIAAADVAGKTECPRRQSEGAIRPE